MSGLNSDDSVHSGEENEDGVEGQQQQEEGIEEEEDLDDYLYRVYFREEELENVKEAQE
jgi:hypothetical protein